MAEPVTMTVDDLTGEIATLYMECRIRGRREDAYRELVGQRDEQIMALGTAAESRQARIVELDEQLAAANGLIKEMETKARARKLRPPRSRGKA